MKVTTVTKTEDADQVRLQAFYTDGPNAKDNTFAAANPIGWCELQVDNLEVIGKFMPGKKYHVDFTPVGDEPAGAHV